LAKGTTFFIYLAATETNPVTPEPAGANELMHGRNEEILIVDDEVAILEITRETLAAYNYRVLATSSGAEAVSLFARHHTEIDLVITDMLMPGMDGPTLIHTLRKVKPEVRLIAVSGFPSGAQQLHTQGFLKKPFSTAALLKSVRSALDS